MGRARDFRRSILNLPAYRGRLEQHGVYTCEAAGAIPNWVT
jgi:hypothetical protein